jgi:nitrite reductase (NADH) large subunit
MTSKPHLVVIGNGMAGCRAVEEILARDGDRYRITIFGAEPHVNYNRIMLSPLLAGEKSFEDIVINDHAWYADNNIDLVAGDPVVKVDRQIQTVTAQSGRTESYDTLLLATGSDPFIIPVPGHDLPGVVTFRDMDDVATMLCRGYRWWSVRVGGGTRA